VLTVLAVVAEAQQEEPLNPIIPLPNEGLYTALFFAILFVLVKYVLLPPVQTTMDERAERIRLDRESARIAREEAASVVSDFDAELAKVRAEAAVIIDAARAEGEATRRQIMAAAEADVADQRAVALAEIEQAKAQALAQLKPQVVTLAALAASRVVDRPLDVSSQRPIIERYLDSLN
jgi:F-type H+-transporting ATPase subunit b